MKCDELKEIFIVEGAYTENSPSPLFGDCLGYGKEEVDEAIAELKDKCQMHDFFWEGCWFAKRGFKNTIAVSEALDRLEAENSRLRRALWLARAERAKLEWKKRVHDFPIGSLSMEAYKRTALYKWEKCEQLCSEKAKEYKSEADKVIAHNKYKRCLAMAKWCEATALWCWQAANTLPAGFHATLYGKRVMIEPDRLFKRHVLLTKWSDRWSKLAEKFKEAK